MVASRSAVSVRRTTGKRNRPRAKAPESTLVVGLKDGPSKRRVFLEVKMSDAASFAFADSPKGFKVLLKERMKVLLQGYGNAIDKSRAEGQRVSFRVDVDPEGGTAVTPIADDVVLPPRSDNLESALTAARERGRLRAADILSHEDMLSAEEFAKLLGTTRVTVNTKRRTGQVLGLDGAKRGFRFPNWQLNAEGKPYAELASLHELLGGPWAVYRFLVQRHGELNGMTGREALERGKVKSALKAAESVGRDFS